MQLLNLAFEAIGFSFLFTVFPLTIILGAAIARIESEKNRQQRGSSDNRNPRSTTRAKSTGGGRVSAPSRTATGPRSNVVPRLEKPYWEKRGWSKRNGDLVGYYRTKQGAWKGKVENYKGTEPKLFIFDPPAELNSHSHSNCFMPREGDKFFVHFNPPGPGDVGTAIQKVEQILKESFKR